MRVLEIDSDIRRAVDVMRHGGIILYPTDTVWGIGCDAACSEAVRRIFTLKRRADSKAMISLVGSDEMLAATVGDIPDAARALIADERPVTVVYSHVTGLAPELLAADGSAAIRLSREAYSSRLCLVLGRPVVSTSANISGRPTPRFFSEIEPEIVAGVDYAASYRRDDTAEARPSKIVILNPDMTLTVVRP